MGERGDAGVPVLLVSLLRPFAFFPCVAISRMWLCLSTSYHSLCPSSDPRLFDLTGSVSIVEVLEVPILNPGHTWH